MPEDAKQEPQVRVVDRRWWARGENAESTTVSTKPTYVEELERQLADKSIKVQNAAAEFEQAKLRIRRDVAREVERSRRAILVELLDVLDNLDRALSSASGDPSGIVRGVELVRDQFLAKLEAWGVKRLAAIDQPFDASLHEALGTTSVSDPDCEGRIVAVVKEGYTIGGDVLRPAAVIVGALQ